MMSQKHYIDNKNQNINCCPKVPKSIMTASRCELTDIQMKVCGNLLADLYGHVFMVAPTGTIDSSGLPYMNGDSLMLKNRQMAILSAMKTKINSRSLMPIIYPKVFNVNSQILH